ncbi:peptidoglycan-binding protein [Streptomyces griseoviridis]
MALRVVPAAAAPAPAPAPGQATPPAPESVPAPAPALTEETLTLGTVPASARIRAPHAVDALDPLGSVDAAGSGPARRGRRGRAVLFGAGGAVVAVVAASLAVGVLSYESPTRDDSRADGVRAGVPDRESEPASKAPSASAAATRPVAVPSRPAAGATPSGSPSASPSAASPTPSASASVEPSGTPSDPVTVEEPVEPTPTAAAVLRRGDQGAEVTELQLRLRQLNLYVGDVDGRYGRRVEAAVRGYQWARGVQEDGPGVYGAATRQRLEAETSAP